MRLLRNYIRFGDFFLFCFFIDFSLKKSGIYIHNESVYYIGMILA